jgi:hypothetical protein
VFHIERDDLLDVLEHPNSERYGGQRIFVVRHGDYVYLVPFVEDEHTVSDVTHEARCGAAHGLFGTLYDVGDAAGPCARARWWRGPASRAPSR